MDKKMKRKENLFGIVFQIIVALVQAGIFEPIVQRKGVRVNGKHVLPENGYFRVKWLKNVVWMHIQDGYGIFINEYVKTSSGKRVNLVEILSQYYWYIENQTGIIKCYDLDCRALYRCIESIIIYGNINRKMPKWLEVHHKWWKWCNTQNTMQAVCHKKHQHFHNKINSRKSHKRGVLIRNVKDFMDWKKEILLQDARLKNKSM